MKEYISEFKRILPSGFCKKIISYHKDNFEEAKIILNNKTYLDKETRNCLRKDISVPKTFGEKILLNYIKAQIFNILNGYKQRYPDLNVKRISQIEILKYEKNSHPTGFALHIDHGDKAAFRALSVSIALNNDYDGGEFVFKLPEGEFVYEQNIGDVLVFPSNWMFPHQVNKITNGTRYAIVSWLI